ncbi:cysteine-rich receptor-like protein kinase 2 isoform X2 [Cynara cardunculus var. scolymus]|uniref:cysteine-rich receptor-like protein kinase 2 isoform X2 n=1 Tax=Cynara cardunculus var. scolymus TaxID=59895 RepID=UPI000D62878E|nr:cysteine-rich receptor-like protein kinase 2 isoform X2 [Cynara cardunculus var. scolymus]
MNMKQVEKSWFSWRLSCLVVVVVVFISMTESVTSQSNNINSTFIRDYCSLYRGMSEKYFLSNLNTTLSSLRQQLSVNGVRYAVARSLLNGESVWGLASCREYVSKANCVACFDYAIAQLKKCGLGNGAHAFYNDCDVRYENNNFYAEANIRAGVVICGNITSLHPKDFRKTAERLLSDLRTAVPRISNFYAASTRRIANGNGTIYAIAQCNLNLSQSVCEDCLNARYGSLDACLPSTTGRAIDNGCFMRYSQTRFFGQNQTTNITPFLWDGDSSKKRSIIGGVVGGVCCLLLVILALFIWHHRSKKASSGQRDKSTRSTELLQGPARYSYNDLKIATHNFSDECRLGGGVFGEVYKGTFKDGDTVAIKKTVMGSTRGKIHFDDELKIISNVHHRHLIRLLGYCSKGPLLFLVHEYMDNGSLDQFLYGDKSSNLSWRQRFEIIFGTARGLAYLHEQYHVTIIHRDIKTSNILLDNELQPKIADFGLIRLLPEDKTHLSTKLAGSLDSGFVAPEYAIHGQLSEKVDTYSFGIVVLEIISGKRCHDIIDDKSIHQSLLDHVCLESI